MPNIVYTDKRMVAEYGVRPQRVSDEFAKKMVQRGFARVIDRDPQSNPAMRMPAHPIREITVNESLSEEQGLYSFVSWLEKGRLPEELIDVGERCGFQIRRVSGGLMDVQHVMMSDFVMVNIGDTDWQYEFKYALRVCFFQRLVPFVVRWYNDYDDGMLTKQLVTRSRLNVFETEDLKLDIQDRMGDLIHPYIIYNGPYKFWRNMSEVCT